MEELGKALKAVFDKIADFFGIFDLSFFVSGITTGSALFFLYYRINGSVSLDIKENFLRVLLFIIFFYVMGLISFVIGRLLRIRGFSKRVYKDMPGLIIQTAQIYNLQGKPAYSSILVSYNETQSEITNKKKELTALEAKDLASALGGKDPARLKLEVEIKRLEKQVSDQEKQVSDQLYTKVWAEIRDCPEHSSSLSLLNRYWVMTATYDGIGASICAWLAVFFYLTVCDKSTCHITIGGGITAMAILIVIFILCQIEANRHMRNQVFEVIATAAKKEEEKEKKSAGHNDPKTNLTGNITADITIK